MRDLVFVVFLATLFGFGLKRPFLFVLGYAYVDIVAPQRLSYYLLNALPVSLIFFAAAVLGWAATDDRKGLRVAPRQLLILALLAYCGWTTATADFHWAAVEKWAWVWKALVFAAFLPLTLRTRLRIEGLLLFMVLSASSIIVVGGIKTLASGGGYGALNLMVDNNTGLYEGSIISCVAVAIIPIILFLAKHGTVFPADWRVRGFAAALIFACLLIPVGTQARTGLICIGVLAVVLLRDTRRRLPYLAGLAVAVAVAVPLLPKSYTQRMDTIQGYQGDQSAGTRLAVWKWTWDYVQDHPFGGGFYAFLQNKVTIEMTSTTADAAGGETIARSTTTDQARAYHSSYFEMLGEQGFPGLLMWLVLMFGGIVRMEVLRRRYRRPAPGEDWIAPLAGALQHAQLIYQVGCLFVGIAFQPFVWMLVAAQIGLDTYLAGRRRGALRSPMRAAAPVAVPA